MMKSGSKSGTRKSGLPSPMRLPLPKVVQRRLSAGSLGEGGRSKSKSPSGRSLGAGGERGEADSGRGSEDMSEILKKYYEEEDRFLGELEALQHSVTATPDQFSAAEMDEDYSCISRSASFISTRRGGTWGRSQRKMDLDWTISTQAPQTDLLGSFCHLMNYVIHLRKENRGLRKHIACLTEMKNIEKLKNDLLKSSCTCSSKSPTNDHTDTSLAKSARNQDQNAKKEQRDWSGKKGSSGRKIPSASQVPKKEGRGVGGERRIGDSDRGKKEHSSCRTRNQRRVGDETESRAEAVGERKVGTTTSASDDASQPNNAHRLPAQPTNSNPTLPTLSTPKNPAPQHRKETANPSTREKSPRAMENSKTEGKAGGGGAECGRVVGRPPSLSPLPHPTPFRGRSRTFADSLSSTPTQSGYTSPSLQPLRKDLIGKNPWGSSGMNHHRLYVPGSSCFTVKEGAQESLATPPPNGDRQSLSRAMDSMIASSYSADLSSAAESSIPRIPSINRYSDLGNTAQPSSDSDDQPIFSEVSLPTYSTHPKDPGDNRKSVSDYHPCGKDTANKSTGYPQNGPISPHHLGIGGKSPVEKPKLRNVSYGQDHKKPPQEHRSSFLEKIGLKKKVEKVNSGPTLRNYPDPMSQSLYSEPSSSGLLSSSCSFPRQPIQHSRSRDVLPNLVKKAFVKKRKRKISESDSLASSEASGKPYKVINLPNYDSDKLSQIELLQQSLSRDHLRKMKQWEEKRILSQKGENVKKSWLRKPKQSRFDASSPTNVDDKLYFEKSVDNPESGHPGRQNTVIYREPGDEDEGQDSVASKPWTREVSDRTTHSMAPARSSPELNLPSRDIPSDSRTPRFHRPASHYHKSDSNLRQKSPENYASAGHPSLADSVSISFGLFTESEDSVFTTEEAQSENLLGHAIRLQEKNSMLIKQVDEKSREHEQISEKLSSLEKEVHVLKGRYKLDACVEKLVLSKAAEIHLVPSKMLVALEERLGEMDSAVKKFKAETMKSLQESQELRSSDLVSTQKCWDRLEELQRANMRMSHRHMTGAGMEGRTGLMPSYEALYSFAVNLIRKLRQLRAELEERVTGGIGLEMELLQAQSSLLLAHAQIERHKLELRALGKRSSKRPHSFHGEDLLTRKLNSGMSYFLPFKLQGRRSSAGSHQRLTQQDSLEEEFLKLFSTAQILENRRGDNPTLPSVPPPAVPIRYQNYHPQGLIYCNPNPGTSIPVSPLAVRRSTPKKRYQERSSIYGPFGPHPVEMTPLPENFQPRRPALSDQNLYVPNHQFQSVMIVPPPPCHRYIAQTRFPVVPTTSIESRRPLSLIETQSRVPVTLAPSNLGTFGSGPIIPSHQPILMRRRAVFTNQHQERIDGSDVVQMAAEFAERQLRERSQSDLDLSDETEENLFRKKAPPPLRLGNAGQVRTLAANFDASSAPNTPLSKNAPHLLQVSSIPSSPNSERTDHSFQPVYENREVSMDRRESLDSEHLKDLHPHYDSPTPIAFNHREERNRPTPRYVSAPSAVPQKKSLIPPYAYHRIPNSGKLPIRTAQTSSIPQPSSSRLSFHSCSPALSRKSEGQYETLSLSKNSKSSTSGSDPKNEYSALSEGSNAPSSKLLPRRTPQESRADTKDQIRKRFLFGGKPQKPMSNSSQPASSGKTTSIAQRPGTPCVKPLTKLDSHPAQGEQNACLRPKTNAVGKDEKEKKRTSWIMKIRGKK